MQVQNQSVGGIGQSVRTVGLQFRFTNEALIPALIRALPAQQGSRSNSATGQEFITPTQDVGVADALAELDGLGYVLVDAFYQPRPASGGGKPAYIVRFVFARKEFAEPKPAFINIRDQVRLMLGAMLQESMWATQAYINPLFVDHELVEGEFAVMVNMTARTPLIDPATGRSIMVWPRGERSGKASDKVALAAEMELRFLADSIELLPVRCEADVAA
ncbi:MAG: hypothetical protein K8Q97_00425 [Candidatus Andersenbacteria bacterium]|nr:hypothetical protein [Candidatus Andersenbacteria bacterium]